MFSNSHKTIAVFIQLNVNNIDCMSKLAMKMGCNLIYFNLQGMIGSTYREYGELESRFIDAIPFESFDAVIIEPDNINIETTRNKLISRIKSDFKGPVVSLRYEVEGWYCINIDNSSGISEMVDHFIEEHGVTDIAYLSGPEKHSDAIARLESFREAMKRHGLPEDGSGVYFGDFWFNCGRQALNYFMKDGKPPKGIICANDFMAISICQALSASGFRVPDDVLVSGFDGSVDGKLYFPPITTVSIECERVVTAAMELLNDLFNGRERDITVWLQSENSYKGSCGCVEFSLMTELKERNNREFDVKYFGYRILSMSVVTLEFNKADSVEKIQQTIKSGCSCIGDYDKLYFVAYENNKGEKSYEKPLLHPTDRRCSVISVDKEHGCDHGYEHFAAKDFLPPSAGGEKPQVFFVSDVHFAEHSFGYTAIKMRGTECITDYYNLFTNNLCAALEALLNKNNIAELIDGLEHMSIHDRMTGLFNWHGFVKYSDRMLADAKRREARVCAMTFDMDGLKYINDNFGHYCGDEAITALSRVIASACSGSEIASRLGGDEFFVFASDYTQEKLDSFMRKINEGVEEFNSDGKNRPYTLSVSKGAYIEDSGKWETVDDFRRISDDMMYEEKKLKPHSRK